jgi:hypothetical protein
MTPRFQRKSLLICLVAAVLAAASSGDSPGGSETIEVTLNLLTGGRITGLVVDHTDAGIVLAGNGQAARPFVFAWEEIEPGSALLARRELLILARGSRDRLRAEDHYQLGMFALRLDRVQAARLAFAAAVRLDRAYAERTDRALGDHRARIGDDDRSTGPEFDEGPPRDGSDPSGDASAKSGVTEPPMSIESDGGAAAQIDMEARRRRVRAVYDQFAEKVREVMGGGIELVETDHFLIHTDWPMRDRDMLPGVFESMYTALCAEFDCDPKEDVFLAKCPVFCFSSKGRFWKFARTFDGFADKEAIGYTRSIESSGHVHMALCLGGRRPGDFDRFAYTLVHEGTHAFMHRFHNNRLIPHWVNEGYAELMAEAVLGDKCAAGEKADLLARQYARFDWPLGDLLRRAGPIEVHEYPLAASVVTYLHTRGRERFAGFIRGLKEGHDLPRALADHYAGMTVERLEAEWRQWVLPRGVGAGSSPAE